VIQEESAILFGNDSMYHSKQKVHMNMVRFWTVAEL